MIAFKIKELMELRGVDASLMKAALGLDDTRLKGILDGRVGLTAEELYDVAHWLDVPMWSLMPGPAFRAEWLGGFYEADTLDDFKDIIDKI